MVRNIGVDSSVAIVAHTLQYQWIGFGRIDF